MNIFVGSLKTGKVFFNITEHQQLLNAQCTDGENSVCSDTNSERKAIFSNPIVIDALNGSGYPDGLKVDVFGNIFATGIDICCCTCYQYITFYVRIF